MRIKPNQHLIPDIRRLYRNGWPILYLCGIFDFSEWQIKKIVRGVIVPKKYRRKK